MPQATLHSHLLHLCDLCRKYFEKNVIVFGSSMGLKSAELVVCGVGSLLGIHARAQMQKKASKRSFRVKRPHILYRNRALAWSAHLLSPNRALEWSGFEFWSRNAALAWSVLTFFLQIERSSRAERSQLTRHFTAWLLGFLAFAFFVLSSICWVVGFLAFRLLC